MLFTDTEKAINERRRRRRHTFPSITAIAVMKTPLLLLLCTRFCHSFVVIPPTNTITTVKKTLVTASFNSKESSDSDDNQDEEEPWEWDGVVVEDAHTEEFESADDPSDGFMPSMSFMSMANSVASPALTAAAGGGVTASSATPDFDQYKNMGKIYRMELEKEDRGMNEEDLLEMGGDPAFLDDSWEAEGFGAKKMDDAEFFGWDGEVNEDAHLD